MFFAKAARGFPEIASLFLAVGAGFAVRTGAETVTRGPYLQQGTPSSIIVVWRTSNATSGWVRYGTNAANLNSTASEIAATNQHTVPISGLAPDTKYFYELGTGGEWFPGSTNQYFITSPPMGSPKPTRLWVIGDSGDPNVEAMSVRDAYAAYNGARPTDIFMMLGDNAYGGGLDTEYQAAVFEMYPALLRNTVLWPTRGNHDKDLVYFDIFSLPQNGEAGGVPSGTESYYSFDYANIHFVCLDSHRTDRSTNSPMYAWLDADLAASTQKWLIAFWHHPPYSHGTHDSDTEIELIEMRQTFVPLLESYGVDLVLNGHSHGYERSYFMDGHYGLSSTFTESMKINPGDGRENGDGAYSKQAGGEGNQGAVYTVAGNGAMASTPDPHAAIFSSSGEVGSLVIDIVSNRLDLLFLTGTGTNGDSFTIVKEPGAISPPAAPTNLLAMATETNRIALSWTDNSTNESSFRIERSTNGVDFSQMAVAAANATNSVDAGLASSTTYYYRVRAHNGAGDSSYSGIAQATTLTPPPPPPDLTPPGAVTNLVIVAVSSNTATLHWTAPGDDGYAGTATRYDLRFVTTALAESNWAGATVVSNLPAPTAAGTTQSVTVIGLAATTTYSFGLKAVDKSNNVSLLSNVATATTQSPTNLADITPPAAVTNLQVVNVTSNSATFTWTAPGDDGNTGTANKYDLRRSTATITEANWSSANQISGEPSPAIAGTTQTLTVNGLSAGLTYFFALKTSDEANNISPLSNLASGTTPSPTNSTNIVLIASNTVWKYLDTGTNLGTTWTSLAFDDSAWASGRAQLGYGNSSDVTVVSYGPDSTAKYITTYFRRHFTVADPSVFAFLVMRVQRDDGAVVFLNGNEVFRSNMPTNPNPITYLTVASSSASGTNKLFFWPSPALPASMLVPGDNVVAVEVHQRSESSSQMSFNLELDATPGSNSAPLVSITRSNSQVVLRWSTQPGKHYRVQTAPGLFGNSWTNLGSDITATNSITSISDTMSGTARFYRVLDSD